jgi:hypothetical protein
LQDVRLARPEAVGVLAVQRDPVQARIEIVVALVALADALDLRAGDEHAHAVRRVVVHHQRALARRHGVIVIVLGVVAAGAPEGRCRRQRQDAQSLHPVSLCFHRVSFPACSPW